MGGHWQARGEYRERDSEAAPASGGRRHGRLYFLRLLQKHTLQIHYCKKAEWSEKRGVWISNSANLLWNMTVFCCHPISLDTARVEHLIILFFLWFQTQHMKNIWNPYQAISNTFTYVTVSTMKDYWRLLKTTEDYWKLLKTIEDYRRLSKTIEDY